MWFLFGPKIFIDSKTLWHIQHSLLNDFVTIVFE